ncbi:MAG: metal-dependent hydrolase [Deltaproteobacteria bacterium]|nr:metal-dependent hydrolase [Candidatus Desulfobacula maris]
MASVIGHSLSSYWIYSVIRNKYGKDPFSGKTGIFVIVFLAILPDFDVMVQIVSTWFGGTNSVEHRGFSHSLLFSVLASFFILVVNKKNRREGSLAIITI